MTTGPRPERRVGSGLLRSLLEEHLEPGYEDAARRRAARAGAADAGPAGAATAAGRTARAVVRPVVLLAIGAMLAVSYTQASAQEPRAARTRAALISDARARASLTDRLQRQAAAERGRLTRARASALADTANGRHVAAALRALEIGASLVAMKGPGLVVTVADAPVKADPVTGQPQPADPTGAGRVQDRDLAAIVNGLWAAGAEAVSVDGQRLSPVSTIRSAGGAVLVDFRPVSSPYQIRAIGNAERMQAQFADSRVARSFTTLTQLYGIGFSTTREPSIEVPAAPATQLSYAVPKAPPTAVPPAVPTVSR